MRSLLIILPSEKFEAWSSGLKEIIAKTKGILGQLETTFGRLKYAAYVILLSRHIFYLIKLRFQVQKHTLCKKQALLLTHPRRD